VEAGATDDPRRRPGRWLGASPRRPPPCDAALSHLPGPQEAGFEVDRLGDACDCEGTYECALYEKVIMDYVGYRLCVPARWFWRRYEADDWLGAGDTMEELWQAVNGTGSGVSADTMDALIGCWMIDTAGDRQGRSYGMFFPEGNAPRKFLRYTLDLVLRFSDEIVDEWSGTTSCAGLRAFIERTLAGKEGDTLTEDVGPCKVVFRAVSSTTWLGSHAVQRSCGEATERAMDCAAAGDTPDAFGTAFDDWSQRLDASFQGVADGQWKTVFELRVDSGRAASWDQPAASWLGYAQTDGGVMLVAANRIAFRGYQLDFTMFWARVALQYAYERGDWKAWYGSWVYTRAALSNMVEYGRLWVHEMGHLHMGQGGHCSGEVRVPRLDTACCFDIAAEAWKCRVASRLGLANLENLVYAGDPAYSSPANPCGGGAEHDAYPLRCNRVSYCVPHEAASFAAGPCS
jgi:hypothetical protein